MMKAKENRPSRSCKDTLEFFMDLKKFGAVALMVKKSSVMIPYNVQRTLATQT